MSDVTIQRIDYAPTVQKVTQDAVIQRSGTTGAVGPKGDPGSPGEGYATRAALAAVAATNLDDAYLTEPGREGKFIFSTANLSTQVASDTRQGIYVAPASNPTGASGAWVRQFSAGIGFATWFGMAVDGVADDSPALLAAIARPEIATLLLPAGTIALGARLTRRLGQRVEGVGPETVFSFLPALAGSTAGVFNSPVGADHGGGYANFSVEGNYVGWGSGASARTHVIVSRGVGWLNENIRIKDTYGYATWANSGVSGTYAKGTFRKIHVDNANVQFETTNADGVLFDDCSGTSGDSAAPGYANMGNEAIHPIADSQNVTWRRFRWKGESGAPVSISTTGASQKGIVLDDVEIIQTNNDYGAGIIAGTASHRNEVTLVNVRLLKPDGGTQALNVTHSDVKLVSTKVEGGAIAVNADAGAVIESIGSVLHGRTDPGGGQLAYGVFGSGGSIRLVGGDVAGIGPSGSLAYNGAGIQVAANTTLTPAMSGPDFTKDIIVSGSTGVRGNDFYLGQLRVSANAGTTGNTSRLNLDHGDNGGQAYIESVLRSSAYSDMVVRTRFGDNMGERLRINETGITIPATSGYHVGANKVVGSRYTKPGSPTLADVIACLDHHGLWG